VFGAPPRNPVTETDEPRPAEDYGAAKLAGEGLCREAAAGGLDVSILRPRTLLGPGRLGIFQLLFEWVREGSNIPVLGRGDNVYQFVDVRDFAQAALAAAGRAGPETYHIGTDRYSTMRATLEALCRHAGTGSKVRSVPAWPGEVFLKVAGGLGLSPTGPYHALMYGRSLYFDVAKAKAELGWRPLRSNEEALIDSYKWYLAHRDEVLAGRGGSAHQRKVAPKLLGLARHLL
jgi:nucleoside-diphosphate-sugar epimerase